MLRDLIEDLFENNRNLYHTYSLTATTNLGDGEVPFKIKNSTFTRRQDAEREMYKIADEFDLGRLSKIEDDNHFKTYQSETAKWIKFQINRD